MFGPRSRSSSAARQAASAPQESPEDKRRALVRKMQERKRALEQQQQQPTAQPTGRQRPAEPVATRRSESSDRRATAIASAKNYQRERRQDPAGAQQQAPVVEPLVEDVPPPVSRPPETRWAEGVSEVAGSVWRPVGVARFLDTKLLQRHYAPTDQKMKRDVMPTLSRRDNVEPEMPVSFHPCLTVASAAMEDASSSSALGINAEELAALQLQLWWTVHDAVSYVVMLPSLESGNPGAVVNFDGITPFTPTADSSAEPLSSRSPGNGGKYPHRNPHSKQQPSAAAPPFTVTHWLLVVKCAAELGYTRVGELQAQLPHRCNLDELCSFLIWLTHRYGFVRLALHFTWAKQFPSLLAMRLSTSTGTDDVEDPGTARSRTGASPGNHAQTKEQDVGPAVALLNSQIWPPERFSLEDIVEYRRRNLEALLGRFQLDPDGTPQPEEYTHARGHHMAGDQAARAALDRRGRAAASLQRLVNLATKRILSSALERAEFIGRLGAHAPSDAWLCASLTSSEMGEALAALETIASLDQKAFATLEAVSHFAAIVAWRLQRTPSLFAVYETSNAVQQDADLPPKSPEDLIVGMKQFTQSGPSESIEYKWQATRRQLRSQHQTFASDGSVLDAEQLLKHTKRAAAQIAEDIDHRYTFSSIMAAELCDAGIEADVTANTVEYRRAMEELRSRMSSAGGQPSAGAAVTARKGPLADALMPVETGHASYLLRLRNSSLAGLNGPRGASTSRVTKGTCEVFETRVGAVDSGQTTSAAVEIAELEKVLAKLGPSSPGGSTADVLRKADEKLRRGGLRLALTMSEKVLLDLKDQK